MNSYLCKKLVKLVLQIFVFFVTGVQYFLLRLYLLLQQLIFLGVDQLTESAGLIYGFHSLFEVHGVWIQLRVHLVSSNSEGC